MKIFLLSAISIILLSACATVDPINTKQQAVERSELNLPAAEPLELSGPPSWIVVTPENASDVFKYLEQEGYEPVIFGLTDQGYKKLSIDFTRIRQHINNQRRILLQYKQYYEDSIPPESSTQ